MGIEQQYPEIAEFLDVSDDYENSGTEFKHGIERYLIVTQRGIDGQQLLFKWNGKRFEYWDNETIINSHMFVPGYSLPGDIQVDATLATCGPSTTSDHDKVYEYMLTQVDVFDSSSGPDHGNLACCWTVRHIVYNILRRWITLTEGTADFGDQLRSCFHAAFDEADVAPGGIIISPTQSIPGTTRRNIGHVGLLGKGHGGQRLVYSNSSAHARFEQNHTIASWKARYVDLKHLEMLFYPLPIKSISAVS